jgi:hypothetical protein
MSVRQVLLERGESQKGAPGQSYWRGAENQHRNYSVGPFLLPCIDLWKEDIVFFVAPSGLITVTSEIGFCLN